MLLLKELSKFLEITEEPAVTTMEGTPVEETFYTLNQLASWDASRIF